MKTLRRRASSLLVLCLCFALITQCRARRELRPMEQPGRGRQANPISKVYLLIPDGLGLSSYNKEDEQQMMAMAAAAVFSATAVGVVAVTTPTAARGVTEVVPTYSPPKVVTVAPTSAAPSAPLVGTTGRFADPSVRESTGTAATSSPATTVSGSGDATMVIRDGDEHTGTVVSRSGDEHTGTVVSRGDDIGTTVSRGDDDTGTMIVTGSSAAPSAIDTAPIRQEKLMGILSDEKTNRGIQAVRLWNWADIPKPNPGQDILLVADVSIFPTGIGDIIPGLVFRRDDIVYEVTDVDPIFPVKAHRTFTARGYSQSRLFSNKLRQFDSAPQIDPADFEVFQRRQNILSKFQDELQNQDLDVAGLIAKPKSRLSFDLAGSKVTASVQRELGRGSFGSVYSIKFKTINPDQTTESFTVAMKRTDATAEGGPTEFLTELNALQAMNGHPSFPRFYGGRYTQKNELILFMEQVQLLTTVTKDQADEAWQGLEAFHKQGFVHNDIKPDNLGIGDDGMIKFIDMGSAEVNAPGTFQRGGSLTPRWSLPARTALLTSSNPSGRYLVAATEDGTPEAIRIQSGMAELDDGIWKDSRSQTDGPKEITRYFGKYDPQAADNYSLALTFGNQFRTGGFGSQLPTPEELKKVYQQIDTASLRNAGIDFPNTLPPEDRADLLQKLLNNMEGYDKNKSVRSYLKDKKWTLIGEPEDHAILSAFDDIIAQREIELSKRDFTGRAIRKHLKGLDVQGKCPPLCQETLERLERKQLVLKGNKYFEETIP